MKELYSLTFEELQEWLVSFNEPKFRAKQIFYWLYTKNISNFFEMTNVGEGVKSKLSESFSLPLIRLVKSVTSKDLETVKFLWQLADGHLIESVLIISGSRRTVCVSSQVGCPARCSFCASGKRGFFRNLTAGEMVEQVLHINNFLKKDGQKVSHVVFMGMGEPLENQKNVLGAISIINSPEKLNISKRRITLSTVGVIPGIEEMIKEELRVNLVLSLHAPNQKLRQKIIPYAKKYPLEELIKATDNYFKATKRNITYEYILIDGLNDQIEHARELAILLKGRQCTVNIIPYNPVEGVEFKRPSAKRVRDFCLFLSSKKIINTCRYTKGDDIAAACGQLAQKNES